LPHHGQLFQYNDVRKNLNLTDEQFNQLNQNFNQLNSQFTTEFGKLNEQDRDTRASDLRNRYWGQWNSGVNKILRPEQLKRYRQLDVQYRGWGALMDSQLQTQLNLTPAQKQRLNQLYNESLQTYGEIYRMGQTNRDAALQRYNQWREQTRRGINDFLTEEQRRNWMDLSGDAYTFTPNFGPTNNRPPTNATVPREPAPNR
jgi:phage-related tail protein